MILKGWFNILKITLELMQQSKNNANNSMTKNLLILGKSKLKKESNIDQVHYISFSFRKVKHFRKVDQITKSV